MNLKKIFVGLGASAVMFGATVIPAFAGFDEFGYNDKARNFVGTGGSWCANKGYDWDCSGYPLMMPYANDKLVMKWNKAWDDCNDLRTPEACQGAWTSNEWNGRADGSGEVWHYKIVWVGDQEIPVGAYPIWGQYAVVMDNGSNADRVHTLMHSSPNGYGAF